jgi:hypothetical protein
MAAKKKMTRRTAARTRAASSKPKCGLCGKGGRLAQTECCGNWICDDYEKYQLFSYSTKSCRRNHDRYTLCCHHHNEGHEGDWRSCQACRDGFETEMYVWYGTNEFNFTKLENPPTFEPTHCSKCKRVIHLGTDGYTTQGDNYFCQRCFPMVTFGARQDGFS